MIDHDLRRRCVTSTDIPPIMGMDEYRGPFAVVAEKKGWLKPEPPNPAMLAGKILEQPIIQIYARVAQCAVRWHDQTMLDPDRDWMAASPDAFELEHDEPVAGLDAKFVLAHNRRQWGATADDIPDRALLQAVWMMAVTRLPEWRIVALVGEPVPRIYTLERDLELEARIIEVTHEFRCRFIIGDEMPPIDGTDATARWLKQTFPRPKRAQLREANADEAALLDEYVNLRIDLDDLERQKTEIQHMLQAAVGDDDGVVWEGGKFTWRRAKGATTTNWEALANSLLNVYVKDEDAKRAQLKMFTTQREGYRRIYLDSELWRESKKGNHADTSAA